MQMVKDISKLIIDGKDYSISKDRKLYTGPTKKYTSEEYREEMGGQIQIIFVPSEAAKDGIAYGFSNEEKLEKWLKATNRFDEYKKNRQLEKRLEKMSTPEHYKEVREDQIKLVKKTTEKYMEFLKQHNLKPDDFERRREILQEHNPYYKFRDHSLYLFDLPNFQAPWKLIGLRGGDSYCNEHYYIDYPNLGDHKDQYGEGFDNRASALATDCGSYGVLFTDINLEGAHMFFNTYILNLDFVTYSFDNSISSARVY
jgi:hypothetical protein